MNVSRSCYEMPGGKGVGGMIVGAHWCLCTCINSFGQDFAHLKGNHKSKIFVFRYSAI